MRSVFNKKGIVNFRLYEFMMQESTTKFGKPLPESLLEAIKRFFKLQTIAVLGEDNSP